MNLVILVMTQINMTKKFENDTKSLKDPQKYKYRLI